MAELAKFEGDMFWDEADTENNVNDPDEALENIGDVGAIIEFEQAKRLDNFYGVLCREGSPCRYFTTLVEAELCAEAEVKP